MKAAKRRRVTLKTENAVNRKNNQNRFGRHALSSCLNARHCGRNRVGKCVQTITLGFQINPIVEFDFTLIFYVPV